MRNKLPIVSEFISVIFSQTAICFLDHSRHWNRLALYRSISAVAMQRPVD